MAIDFLTERNCLVKIMITGGESMIGRAIIRQLRGDILLDFCPHKEVDCTQYSSLEYRVQNFQPDYLIALAGYNGGIKFNAEKPADIYYKNAKIALNTLNIAYEYKIPKVVYVMPSCSYPSMDYMSENDYWNGPCHPSVECHGLARSHFFEYSRQLYKQYKFMSVGICFNTAYGPYDHFDENAKVMGSMIRKFVEAKEQNLESVTLWGTGEPRRGFIYCDDVATGILNVLDSYNDPMELINLGCQEIPMKYLAENIAKEVDYTGKIIWDTSKPDGQMRKMLHARRYQLLYEEQSVLKTLLPEGIKKTVKWYKENMCTK